MRDNPRDVTRTSSELARGTLISRYEIERKLGSGGMGAVYLARDTELDRPVALKFLSTEMVENEEHLARFLREARVAASLNHPNVVTIHEVGRSHDRPFIAMEYVEGRLLRELVGGEGLDFRRIADLMLQVAEGLRAAHDLGIAHRDVKPGNIMVTPDGRVKILDFGLAKRRMDPALTHAGTTLGTFLYMSPEQLRGEEADHRSDLFSLGVVLYELTTGHHAFTGSHPAEVAHAILNSPPTPLEEHRADLPLELGHILSKCLEKSPDLRYQSADEMIADLKRLKREIEGGAPDLVPPVWRKGSERRAEAEGAIPALPALPPRGWLAAVGVVAAVGLVALAVWLPPQLRSFEKIEILPGDAERIARQYLEHEGVSLFGFRTYTEFGYRGDRENLVLHHKVSASEWQQVSDWRPLVHLETLVASADRQDTYDFWVSPRGRIYSIAHKLRPDWKPEPISAESAGARAEEIAQLLFGVGRDQFEALPVSEMLRDGRMVREFRWRSRSPFVRELTPTASVSLVGPVLLQADSGIDFPATVVRTAEEYRDYWRPLGWIVFGLGLLVTIFLAIRERSFVLPDPRLGFLTYAVFVIGIVLQNRIFVREFVEHGLDSSVLDLWTYLLVSGPLFSLAIWLGYGLVFGLLRAKRPEILAGLEGAMRLRISRATWCRSGATGLLLGGLGGLLLMTSTAVVLGLNGFREVPHDIGHPQVWESIGVLLAMPLWTTIWISFALAVGVACGNALRCGRWIWPLIVLCCVVILESLSPSLNLGWAGYVPGAVAVSLVFWASLRFGLLSGVTCCIAMFLTSRAFDYFAVNRAVFLLYGAAHLGLWLLLTAFSVYGLTLASHDRGECPSAV